MYGHGNRLGEEDCRDELREEGERKGGEEEGEREEPLTGGGREGGWDGEEEAWTSKSAGV